MLSKSEHNMLLVLLMKSAAILVAEPQTGSKQDRDHIASQLTEMADALNKTVLATLMDEALQRPSKKDIIH